MTIKTKDSPLSDAEICRQNGWTAGTRLFGIESGRREFIRIIAIGMNNVLAFWEQTEEKFITSLSCRNWRQEPKR